MSQTMPTRGSGDCAWIRVLWARICVLSRCICALECICVLWECNCVLGESICVLWGCICVVWECIPLLWECIWGAGEWGAGSWEFGAWLYTIILVGRCPPGSSRHTAPDGRYVILSGLLRLVDLPTNEVLIS